MLTKVLELPDQISRMCGLTNISDLLQTHLDKATLKFALKQAISSQLRRLISISGLDHCFTKIYISASVANVD